MWITRGQDPIIATLQAQIAAGQPAHAYLLVGPDGIGKNTLANDIFAALNCTVEVGAPCWQCASCVRIANGSHTDVSRVALAEGATRVRIEDIREAVATIHLTALEGRYRALVIDDAHLFSPESANALLKTLEEPPTGTLVIVLAENELDVMDTVRSRCRTLRLSRMPPDAIAQLIAEQTHASLSDATLAAQWADGCPGKAIAAVSDRDALQILHNRSQLIQMAVAGSAAEKLQAASTMAEMIRGDREETTRVIQAWHQWWRDVLADPVSTRGDRARAIERIEAGDRTHELINQNVNARAALERMLMFT